MPSATFLKDFPRHDASLRTWPILLPIALTLPVVSFVIAEHFRITGSKEFFGSPSMTPQPLVSQNPIKKKSGESLEHQSLEILDADA